MKSRLNRLAVAAALTVAAILPMQRTDAFWGWGPWSGWGGGGFSFGFHMGGGSWWGGPWGPWGGPWGPYGYHPYWGVPYWGVPYWGIPYYTPPITVAPVEAESSAEK
jgi:hypothetical protein